MKSAELHILALNSGSSSLKFGLFKVGSASASILTSGEAGSIGAPQGAFAAQDEHGKSLLSEQAQIPTQRDAVIRIARLLAARNLPTPDAVGHRIVHGGPRLLRHCIIDASVLGELQAASALAPLHTPPALSVIGFAREHFPQIPHMACFDTTFHSDLPQVAQVLPIAKEWRARGIRRYGFHGLSCESIVHQLADELPERLIVAHLGNGASVTAIRAGRSVDTSMGLTPTGGVIMGSRSGDLDPGLLIYLLREAKLSTAELEDLVDHHSGLAGISGVASDMRRLRASATANADAALAVEMFCYSVAKQLAAMIAVLDGVDLIAFTGGIGEHDARSRAEICRALAWIGVRIDDARNDRGERSIHAPESRCGVRVMTSQEDEQIVRHAWDLFPRS